MNYLIHFNMKRFLKTSWVFTMLLAATGCGSATDQGFEGCEVFVKDFEQRQSVVENGDYFSVFQRDLTTAQKQALQFLYAYMALPDVTDYSGDYYLENVDYALRARAEMPWGEKIPDREFLHFVLPVRVNNENMDGSRAIFYNELKDRVKHLSMHDAVLEVNHWCHEKVTYMPSDSRTSSPLASIRTAYGRCGEESTFTVAALRAVGIPARQVYTPRWAHTDSNHAWVEAWIDGEWHFLGACEPEPVLDLAWFNAPASRGMLMHTKAFGRYSGPEEVVSTTPCFTEINVTQNYAPTAPLVVRVEDEHGNPLATRVDFKIYNYAEFFTAASTMSNEEGYATLTTGKGTMLAWAAHEGQFGFTLCKAGTGDTAVVVVDKGHGYEATFELDIVPPAERNTLPEVTPEQRACNTERLAYEDSVRLAYVATFMKAEEMKQLADSLGLDANAVTQVLTESRGNHAVLAKFLRTVPQDKRQTALTLLQVISEKDRHDVPAEVLADQLLAPAPKEEHADLYNQYVLCPRVSNEMLTPYRAFFKSVISEEQSAAYVAQPEIWVAWCRENITVNDLWNPLRLCMSPKGVWQVRVCDAHSRDIFFVSAARSIGIAARIDAVTGKVQYADNKQKWVDVNFEVENLNTQPQGTLVARYTPSPFVDDPKYGAHFSISKIVDGRLQLQQYSHNETWSSLLKNGAKLDVGDYLLVSGTRMADGGVLAHLTFVNIPASERTVVNYVQRASEQRLQVVGNFNSENIFYDIKEAKQRSILSATGRGYYIIAIVAPSDEPTNHFLRDLAPYKNELEQWGQKMVLLFRGENEAKRLDYSAFPNLPNNIIWGTDVDNKIYNEMVHEMKLKHPNTPIILVADTFNRVVFVSHGYSIGLGEQLAKVITQLQGN